MRREIAKPWYQSRLLILGAVAVLNAAADGIVNQWGWRQTVAVAIGALVVVLRVDTKGPVGK